MIFLCLNFKESQPIYAYNYKLYAYKKKVYVHVTPCGAENSDLKKKITEAVIGHKEKKRREELNYGKF